MLSTVLYRKINPNGKTECLINIDSTTPSHEVAKDYVLNTLIKIKEYEGFNSYFEDVLNKRYKDFLINKEDIVNEINLMVDQIHEEDSIFLLNQNHKYESDYSTYSIIIGGILISRGVTFHNLITELILNAPGEKRSIDTLLQRARWFGYRRNHNQYKYMTVYLNNEIYQSLKECNDAITFFEKHYADQNLKNMLIQFEKKRLKFTKLTNKPMAQSGRG